MGTHPIFESDFDCLTDFLKLFRNENMTSELACTYAALILNDDDCEITGDKIATILKAAKVDVGELITNIGSGVGSGGAPAAGGAAPAAAAEEEKAEAKKESSSEEEDDDMGFGPFD